MNDLPRVISQHLDDSELCQPLEDDGSPGYWRLMMERVEKVEPAFYTELIKIPGIGAKRARVLAQPMAKRYIMGMDLDELFYDDQRLGHYISRSSIAWDKEGEMVARSTREVRVLQRLRTWWAEIQDQAE